MGDVLIRGMEMPKYTTKAEFGIDAVGYLRDYEDTSCQTMSLFDLMEEA